MADGNAIGEARAQAKPGWYPDPGRQDAQRYWDGGTWTEQQRSAALASPSQDQWRYAGPTSPRSKNVLVLGWLTALLVPPVGLVVGVIATSQGHRGHGAGIMALAILLMVYYLTAL